uniref:nucleoside-diphosphate kinase n=1 Tax=Ailuropoda melanoleuca TaxID=9646 RepID=A0A7N5JIM4_AILME
MVLSLHEYTFIAIKPDGVQCSLLGESIKRFEQKGFLLIAMKLIQASEDLLKEHYIDPKDHPFFAINSGPRFHPHPWEVTTVLIFIHQRLFASFRNVYK